MPFEHLQLHEPQIAKDLLAIAEHWDRQGEMTKPLQVFRHVFEHCRKHGVTDIGSHPIVEGKMKAKLTRKIQEQMF